MSHPTPSLGMSHMLSEDAPQRTVQSLCQFRDYTTKSCSSRVTPAAIASSSHSSRSVSNTSSSKSSKSFSTS